MPAEPAPPDGRYLAAAVWTVFALNGAAFASWVARVPAVRDRVGASSGELGAALLCVAVGSLLTMPLTGRACARWGARPVVAAGGVVTLGFLPLLGAVTDVPSLALVLFCFGAGYGCWDVAMNVAAHDAETTSGRPLMPRFHMGFSVGAIVGAGTGALVAGSLAPAPHLLAAAVVALCVLVPALRPLPSGRPQVQGDASLAVPGRRLPEARLLALGLLVVCATVGEGAAADWVALLLVDERHASAGFGAAAYAVFATAMALTRGVGTEVVERFGRVRSLRVSGLVAVVGIAVTLLVPSAVPALAGVVLWGLGMALSFPSAMSAAGETPGRGPQSIATVSTIGYLGFLLGPPLVGLLAEHLGLTGALWVVAVVALGVPALAGSARRVGPALPTG